MRSVIQIKMISICAKLEKVAKFQFFTTRAAFTVAIICRLSETALMSYIGLFYRTNVYNIVPHNSSNRA